MHKKQILIPIFTLVLSIIFLAEVQQAQAISFGDIVTGAKKFILGEEKEELTITSTITLVPEGDVLQNGQIDAGDIVRFSYQIINRTTGEISFATVKTNINRKQISFIHNVYGATGITNNENSPTLTNIRIGANQLVNLSFDARINYFTEEDPLISTEAEIISNNTSIAKAARKEIKAKRIKKENIPWLTKPKEE